MITKITSYLERARAQLPAQFKFDPVPFSFVRQIKGGSAGTITPSGIPTGPLPPATCVFIHITGSGQAGVATWGWAVGTVGSDPTKPGYTSMGAAASANIGFGVTVTLVNAATANPSFLAGTYYCFTTNYLGRIDGLIQAWMQEFQAIEDAMWDVFTDRCIQNNLLFGNLEDIIGDIVGQSRQGMTDTVYARFITGRIAANRSDGKRETLIRITQLLAPATTQVVVREYVGAVTVDVTNELDSTDFPELIGKQFLIGAVAAGIRLDFIWSYHPPSDTFTYSDTNAIDTSTPNEGYGDSRNVGFAPGGYYASVVTE